MRTFILENGSCPNINQTLWSEIELIGDISSDKIPYEADWEDILEGHVPTKSPRLLVDGKVVGTGFDEIMRWLAEDHAERVIAKHATQLRTNPVPAMAGV